MQENTKVKRKYYGGGWKPESKRKDFMDIKVPLTIMVTRRHYTKALAHLKKEAQKFRN